MTAVNINADLAEHSNWTMQIILIRISALNLKPDQSVISF